MNPTKRQIRELAKTLKLTTDHSMSSYGIPVFVDASNNPLDYADGLRKIRRTLKLSTDELAEIAGVSRRTVEGWEQGRPISGPAMRLIENFLRT